MVTSTSVYIMYVTFSEKPDGVKYFSSCFRQKCLEYEHVPVVLFVMYARRLDFLILWFWNFFVSKGCCDWYDVWCWAKKYLKIRPKCTCRNHMALYVCLYVGNFGLKPRILQQFTLNSLLIAVHVTLCVCFSNLVHLNLTGIDKISGKSFTSIPTHLPRLAFLDLSQCNQVRRMGF